MLIETDYLNYPPIRNNLTSASLLSMIIEMDYNLLGMKARTVPRCRAEICRARNIFFLSRSTLRCNSVFFSLCHLQIVLLTIANTNIHYFFYRNNDFNGDLTCVRGRKAPAVPRRALPLALVAAYHIFNSRLLEHLSWLHFY